MNNKKRNGLKMGTFVCRNNKKIPHSPLPKTPHSENHKIIWLFARYVVILSQMIKKLLYLIILCCLCCQSVVIAQTNRGVNRGLNRDFGSSASGLSQGLRDRSGNPIDTTAVTDASTVPIGLFSWKIDRRFGNVREVPVDTLEHQFQNTNDMTGMNGHFNHLGNLGSPRINRLYFERRDPSQFIFTDPYDYCVIRPEDLIFTNTKSPFANLSYYKEFDSQNGEERFKSYFATNANKRLGFGFYIDYLYGRGHYTGQSTALFNGGLFSSYRGDKYEMHFLFNNDNLKVAENGGITDDRYITNPLDMAEGKRQYQSYEIPVKLQKIWNHNTSYHAFLSHRYNIGFYREKQDTISADSVKTTRFFIPVTSVIHTFQFDTNERKYISYDDSQNRKYFENMFLGSDSIDLTKRTSIKNTFALELKEGFNKWAAAGLTAFITHEYRKFSLPDSTFTDYHRTRMNYKENVISVGGQLAKRNGKTIHYSALGEIALTGEDSGQFTLEGNADLNFRLFGDTVRLDVSGFVKNTNPVFYYRHFHSKHYWWDNDDLDKMMRTRVEGKLTIGKTGTMLKAGVENIKNYTYLDNTSKMVNNNDAIFTSLNNAAVRQFDGNIQVLSATLDQRIKLGIFHIDAEVTYQKSSENDVLPLPDLSVYGNVYLKGSLAKKVLRFEVGADARYFTKYYAPDYSMAIGQYYLQNPNDRIELGGYPIINLYANLHLKRTRFFIMMSHINQGSGNAMSFLAPHYPINPKMLKLGLSWNFFD